MKIIYRQPEQQQAKILGISNYYFKQVHQKADAETTILKPHHHTDFEIHIITNGSQSYEFEGQFVALQAGTFLIISPQTTHRVLSTSKDMQKFALSFHCDFLPTYDFFTGTSSDYLKDSLEFICQEAKHYGSCSKEVVENRLFEIGFVLLRESGYKETADTIPLCEDDARLTLAKKYICDNLLQNLSASDIADYCHLSERQMARIFLRGEGMTAMQYRNRVRMEQIRKELLSDGCTIGELSEKYGYHNEYYFNKAFKQFFGMPPATYRKMHF